MKKASSEHDASYAFQQSQPVVNEVFVAAAAGICSRAKLGLFGRLVVAVMG